MIKLNQSPEIHTYIKSRGPEVLPIEKTTITLVLSYESEDTPLLLAILRHLDPDTNFIPTSETIVVD